MHLANLTTAGFKRFYFLVLSIFLVSITSAQENSPYSRYGIGDLVPNQNIVNRGMGGIAAGYSNPNIGDQKYVTPAFLFQSINLVNPAAIGGLNNTVFDIGGEVDIRTIKSTSSPEKYTATNTLISYLQLGFPIASEKMRKKGNAWGVSFGIRPISRINYKIEKNERISGVDSLNTLYEGSGGVNQVNIGSGIKIRNFSFGFNTGYSFGTKDYSTKLTLLNDSVVYYRSNTQAKSNFGGFFLNLGAQYILKLKNGVLNLGAYGNFQQRLTAKSEKIDETFAGDGSGGTITIDTVNYQANISGKVVLPATYAAGFTYTSNHWLYGFDLEASNWKSYRYFGKEDAIQNNWMIRAGVQYYPTKYFSFVKYRAGVYYGPDYIKLTESRPNYGITAGASFPLTSLQRLRGEYVVLNTGFEFGARGNKQTFSVKENFTRINIGISMNAKWFQKRSYD
jgi:hypothetical protein